MSEWVTGDGSFGDMTGAPESVQTLIANKGFKDVAGLVEGYNSEVAFKGTMKEKLNLPETLTDDMIGSIHTKLGRPESADKYDFGEGAKALKPEVLEGIKGVAFAQGLSGGQAAAVVKQILDIADMQAVSEQEAEAIVEKAFKEKHGDKYDEYMKEAFDASEKFGITDILDKKGLNRDPDIINMLHDMNAKMSEGKIQGKGTNMESGEKSIDEKIKAATEVPAYTDKMDVGHHAALQAVKDLLAQKHNMTG